MGIHGWAGLSPSLFSCSKLPRVATIGVFRGLRRGGASVRCDEVLPWVATQRQNRWGRQGVSQVSIQSSIYSVKYLFSQVSLPPQSLLFAIIIDFRNHQVSPSSSRFVKFTWNLKGHSRYLQGTSRVQVEPNCVHLDPNLELTT